MTGAPLVPDDDPRVLLADRDRDRASDLLARAFQDGRLDGDAHERRADAVAAARVRADLEQALAGIPASVALDVPERPDEEHDPVAAGGPSMGMVWLTAAIVLGLLTAMTLMPPAPVEQAPADVAAEVRDGWGAVGQVEVAERTRLRRAGRYTADDATLQLANPALLHGDSLDDVQVRVTEDRRGAILTYSGLEVDLTATLDERGQVRRTCRTRITDEPCPTSP